ncbi:hypothetical protein GCM10007094_43910 [Pseudovibrio japonicus]|uniref:Uncharacterized protein n=1 Tax=Pseudovibrio japonicus TaxID=366534 RepID=A0ABQ3ETI5_9HYPH|nr:hypothetical protein GCM10007094_43910 [Pseudovibrio japonicus]
MYAYKIRKTVAEVLKAHVIHANASANQLVCVGLAFIMKDIKTSRYNQSWSDVFGNLT